MVTTEQIKAKIEEAKTNPNTARELQKRLETGIYDSNLQELGIARTSMGLKPVADTKILGDIGQDIRGIGTDIADNSFKRDAKIQEIRSAMESGEQGDVRSILQTSGQLAGAGADAIGAVAKGAFNALIPQTTEEAITQKIGGAVEKTKLPEVMQKYELLKQTNPILARDIDAALGIASLGAEFIGLDVAKRGTGAVVDVAGDVAKRTAGVSDNIVRPITNAGRTIADVASDITPTKATLRDRAVAKAFRLAPVEDLATIEQFTGNKVGEFMDRYDLIKNTASESADALSTFKRENLNRVNDAIATVDDTYTYADIPELQSTITFLKKDLAGRSSPEYQQVLERLNRIDETGQFNLMDAQYVKNVFDDIESVYKRTGEVRDAINAQDKAQTIAPVRRFIEDRVSEQYPNIDIRSINNNVQTTSAILDAIVKRAPKGDTASMLKLGDFAVIGLGNQLAPGTGFAALFGKKIIESAPMQLRMARFWAKKTKEELKGMSLEELKQVDKEITEALKDAIGMGDTQAVSELTAVKSELKAQSKVSPKSQKVLPKSYDDTVPQTSKKVKGETPSKLRKNSQAGFIATGYKNEGNLTTKILKDLEGKTTVSKQYILDATNRGELKQVERDITRQVLENMKGDTINVKEFADKVKSELLPLKRINAGNSSAKKGGYASPKYENVSLPDELKGNVKNYQENIYESPIKTSAGNVHFGRDSQNYFGHTRIEDMADNKTRRVIEVQSDLYQKGNLEKSVPFESKNLANESKRLEEIQSELYKIGDNTSPKAKKLNAEKAEIRKAIDARPDPKATNVAKLQQYNDPTAHFRMVREEIKKAAQDGKTKLQFPTGETAMKIEGLGTNEGHWYDNASQLSDAERRTMTITQLNEALPNLKPENLKVGMEVVQGGQGKWIITDVLGDGKFKAVPKSAFEGIMGKVDSADVASTIESLPAHQIENMYPEQFDISGKVDTNNPIYKFYEKEVQKYLNKFGGKRVVDDKGVSWIEIPITKEQGISPVDAFGKIQISPLYAGAGLSLAGVAGASAIKKRKK